MKGGPDNHRDFNPMHEVLRRAAYLACLGSVTAGMVLTLIGVVSGELVVLAAGLGGMATGVLTREWLRRSASFEAADFVFAAWLQGGSTPDPNRVVQFVSLLREHDALERLRGGPKFDPWALQVVRNDIRTMLQKDPALERLLRP